MQFVVLVDEENREIGTMQKDQVHTTDTALHRGFSVFVLNKNKELLVTRRAKTKKTFPGVWSNTACGHPAAGEDPVDAARRRLAQELGIRNHELRDIREVAPYRYRFIDQNGIVENEICPILIGFTDQNPSPNPSEVEEWRWMKWEDFLKELEETPSKYSPWCREEARILDEKVYSAL